MITDNEKFIEIQGILLLSDISPNDCIKINNLIIDLSEEIQELKKQLEDKCDFINKLQATKCKLNKWDYENTMKQQEFIKYLQEELNVQIQEESIGCETINKRYILEEIIQKYREIIGDDK